MAEEPVNGAPRGSVAERMARARAVREGQKTRRFLLPPSDGTVAVELKVISYEREHRIWSRNEQIDNKAMRDLSNAADLIAEATVQFWLLDDATGEWTAEPGTTWADIARVVAPAAGMAVPDGLTPRNAVILISEQGESLGFLLNQYQVWLATGRSAVSDEVSRDFETTR